MEDLSLRFQELEDQIFFLRWRCKDENHKKFPRVLRV
jgi:hypothetical protein